MGIIWFSLVNGSKRFMKRVSDDLFGEYKNQNILKMNELMRKKVVSRWESILWKIIVKMALISNEDRNEKKMLNSLQRYRDYFSFLSFCLFLTLNFRAFLFSKSTKLINIFSEICQKRCGKLRKNIFREEVKLTER